MPELLFLRPKVIQPAGDMLHIARHPLRHPNSRQLQRTDFSGLLDRSRNEFTPNGYFPGIALRPEPPRLFLVSPALEFHPATETVLRYFAPAIDVERVGVGVEWRKELQVMFQLRGAERP